jgi:hypothetical protein
MGRAYNSSKIAAQNFKNQSESIIQILKNGIPQINNFGKTVVQVVNNFSRIAMGMNALKGAFDIDPDTSGFEKFV